MSYAIPTSLSALPATSWSRPGLHSSEPSRLRAAAIVHSRLRPQEVLKSAFEAANLVDRDSRPQTRCLQGKSSHWGTFWPRWVVYLYQCSRSLLGTPDIEQRLQQLNMCPAKQEPNTMKPALHARLILLTGRRTVLASTYWFARSWRGRASRALMAYCAQAGWTACSMRT